MIRELARLVAAFIFVSMTTFSSVAQEYRCPTVRVECVSLPDCCPSLAEFAVRLSGPQPPVVSYNWTVSAGRIVRGQGTTSIKVISPPGKSLTATVEILGPDPKCPRVASFTIICDASPPVRLFDRYFNLSFTTEKARLDRFARQLKNEPTARGFILVTGNGSQAKRAKEYLVTHHSLEADRVVAMSKRIKSAKPRTRLFIVPAGVLPPTFTRAGELVPTHSECPQIRYRGGLAL